MQNTSTQKEFRDEYHDFYIQSNRLLQSDVYKNLVNAFEYMNLILLILFQHNFLLAWEGTLRKIKVKLELLTNVVLFLMVENGIKGGACHFIYGYAEANNKSWKIMIQKRIVISYVTLENMVENKSKCFTNISVFSWDCGRKTWYMWSWSPDRDISKSFFVFHHKM